MVVGVGGKYCSGKDTVARMLESRGFDIINVDTVGHQVLEEEKDTLVREFGATILDSHGSVDRKRLGTIVFNNRHARERLESVVHPAMVRVITDYLREKANEDIVINAALLFTLGLEKECDLVLWITAPVATRIRRARARDKLPLIRILQRFWAQRSLGPQHSRNDVDIYIVENSGSHESVAARVIEILANEGA